MAEIQAFPGQGLPAHLPPRPSSEIAFTSEALRRGVQYLAFRTVELDLVARYEPGPGPVNGLVARAAQAALKAHQQLVSEQAAARSPARSAALAARQNFSRQLADVKAGVTRAPTVALRSAYLDALTDFILETARREGVSAVLGVD